MEDVYKMHNFKNEETLRKYPHDFSVEKVFLRETFVQVYYSCVRLSGPELWIPMQVVYLRVGPGHPGARDRELNWRREVSQYKPIFLLSGKLPCVNNWS